MRNNDVDEIAETIQNKHQACNTTAMMKTKYKVNRNPPIDSKNAMNCQGSFSK